MTELVTLAQVKDHLKQPADSDTYLQGLATAAIGAVKLHTGRKLDGSDENPVDNDLAIAAQAVLMLVATWWSNRDSVSTGSQSAELPLAVTWLLMPLKIWTV